MYSFPSFPLQHALNAFTARHRTNSKNDRFPALLGQIEEYKHFKIKRDKVILMLSQSSVRSTTGA